MIDRPADKRKPTRIMGGQTLPGAIEPPTIAVMKAGTYLDARLIAAAPDMLAALEAVLIANPVFRAKPEGAPMSPVRLRQVAAIEAEDMARTAITNARSVK